MTAETSFRQQNVPDYDAMMQIGVILKRGDESQRLRELLSPVLVAMNSSQANSLFCVARGLAEIRFS